MSRTLWAFDLTRPVDLNSGKEIIPDINNIQEGLFICPGPFAANIKPRTQNRAMAVQKEWEDMKDLLDEQLQWKRVPEGLKWRDYEPED